MKMRATSGGVVFVLCAFVFGGVAVGLPPDVPSSQQLLESAAGPADVMRRLDRYVPIDLGATALPAEYGPMLEHLKSAADHIDGIYWDQVSARGAAIRRRLVTSETLAARNLVALMDIHYGPWDRHADDAPFVGLQPRPPGANLYRADVSRHQLEAQLAQMAPEAADALLSPYSVVRRDRSKLKAVPYSAAYAPELRQAAASLSAAAEVAPCPEGGCPCATLATFLRKRADALMSNDYTDSELAWLDATACPIDIAIGPYEVYEDRLAGVKTAFEAIITLRDDAKTATYEALTKHYDGLMDNIPVSKALRARFVRAKPSPITVADVLYTAGDARAGYQMRAFVLPNDPKVREARGTKNVILQNVVRAKFDALAKPVGGRMLAKKHQGHLSADAYLDFLLSWQLTHAIVPGPIARPGGVTTTARRALRARATIIEAVKGEAVALHNWFYLKKKKAMSRKVSTSEMAHTYLVSLFDSVRAAAGQPQTIAKAIVYNYLAKAWVFRYDPHQQTFEVNPPALEAAVEGLAGEVLDILARGDYDGAGRLIVEYGLLPSEVQQKLASLSDLLLDIRPNYTAFSQ